MLRVKKWSTLARKCKYGFTYMRICVSRKINGLKLQEMRHLLAMPSRQKFSVFMYRNVHSENI